jgi:dsRNA-specific ribonuclease
MRLLTHVREEYFGRDNVEKWGMQYEMLTRVQVAGGMRLECGGKEGKKEWGIAGDVFTAYIGALDFISHSSVYQSEGSLNGADTSSSDNRDRASPTAATDSDIANPVPSPDLATTFIHSLLNPTLESKIQAHLSSSSSTDKSALATLNEKLTQRGMDSDQQRKRWTITEQTGKEFLDSPRRFTAKFRMSAKDFVVGEGRNVKEAKGRVAEEILKREDFGAAGRGH